MVRARSQAGGKRARSPRGVAAVQRTFGSARRTGNLPFTGLALTIAALLGGGALILGLALRRGWRP